MSSLNHLKVFLEVSVVALMTTCMYYIRNNYYPVRRGFYCDDEDIRYPFIKDQTVSLPALNMICTLIPIPTVLLVEFLREVLNSKTSFAWRRFIKSTYYYLIIFAFSTLSSSIITEFTKVTVGRLRPHFIDVCRPFSVAPSLCPTVKNEFQYVELFNCSNEVADDYLRETRKSFISGHSSFSAVTLIFTVILPREESPLACFGPGEAIVSINFGTFVHLDRVDAYIWLLASLERCCRRPNLGWPDGIHLFLATR